MNAPINPHAWLDNANATGSLAGVRVLDLSRVVAGPLCAQMLADHGADVIKVESRHGDETRHLGPPFLEPGQAAYFSALNRGKRSLALDLSESDDRAVIEALLVHADVLIENFVPGTMQKWGLGFDDSLSKKFPQLIYCGISGFGAEGPLGGLPGYDAVLQAMCGLMSINGDAHTGPMRTGMPIVDIVTGYNAFAGITMALLARARIGRGQRVDATLFDTALSLLIPHAVNWMASGQTPGLWGNAHPNIPTYNRFDVGDGQMFLGILNDAQFVKFCKKIDRVDLALDVRFQTNASRIENRDVLHAQMDQALKPFTRAALCKSLMEIGIPAGPVHNVAEALQQPHTAARDMLVTRPDYQGLGLPIKLSSTPGQVGRKPPMLGESNPEILKRYKE
jgi:crotonobetainyl-CoA:carnitine CoA-transferase CaiB-like acyl-CoA transferase